MQVEQLIFPRWIIPVMPERVVWEQHALAINAGRIQAILPAQQAREQFEAKVEIELPGHALIPGFVNAHTHTPMSLFRGLADDMPLMTWLNQHIWPAESRWMSDQFVADGSALAIAEMIRSGTTCFNDMYFHADATARTAAHIGMRAMVGMILIDFPSSYAKDTDEYLNKAIALYDEYKGHELVRCAFSPHAPYSVSDQPLSRLRTLAHELDTQVHMHVHETKDEIQHSLNNYGQRPLPRLHDLGLLTPNLVAVHMTQMLPEEIELVADNGVHVVHCPESNMKLASGSCPVAKLWHAGVNVALGTDGAASNNDLDMMAEMRSAALLAKHVAEDASALPAWQALRMATYNGAVALGLDDQIGSLEVGKQADMVAIDLDQIETQPLYEVQSHLVYAASRAQITDVWIAGKQLLSGKVLTTINASDLRAKAKQWQHKIAQG